MSHVFVSYARADYKRAQSLAGALQQSRVPVWWDPQISLGDQWAPAIHDAIVQAVAVVVLWSRSSVNSEWVHREANLALERGNLVPALIDSIRPPGRFGQFDCADLSSWDPRRPHREFDQLRRHLLSLFGRTGGGQVQRLDQETLLVRLDYHQHTVRYSRGHLYVNGEVAVEGVPMVIDERSFNFELQDGNRYFPARLEVWVTMMRGKVKRLRLAVGGRVLYDG